MKNKRTGLRNRRSGFTLMETMVSSLLFVGLMAALYTALGDATKIKDIQDAYAQMEMDAREAMSQMAEELRMSGRVENPAPGQPDYPYTFLNGDALGTFNNPSRHPAADVHVEPGTPAWGDCREIVFLLPTDNDGDGLLTSSATGDIEWTTYDIGYVLVTGPDGINRLERWENGTYTRTLAHYAERVVFDTIDNDPAVGMDEIVITLYLARPIPGTDRWLQNRYATRVTMRNAEDL